MTLLFGNHLGEYAASTLKKGDKVIVQGKLKYREFQA